MSQTALPSGRAKLLELTRSVAPQPHARAGLARRANEKPGMPGASQSDPLLSLRDLAVKSLRPKAMRDRG